MSDLYVPDVTHPQSPSFPLNVSTLFWSTNTPTADPGVPGALCIKTTTGSQYYWDGSIWHLISSGTGGTVQVLHGAFADPNSNVTPDDPSQAAIYYQDGAGNNQWRWSISGVNWLQTMG